MLAEPQAVTAAPPTETLAWQLLLPVPAGGAFRHLVLLGASNAVAAHVVGSGIARKVSRALPSRRTADALVILHTAATDLRKAVACLAPGGAFYCELTGGYARARRAIARGGLSRIAAYWCAPCFPSPTTFVPLDANHVLHWYCRNIPASSRQEVARRHLLQYSAIFGSRIASRFVRSIALTGVASDAGPRRPFVFATPPLRERFAGADLRILVLGARNERAILLAFAPEGATPCAALKVPNKVENNGEVEREQRVLASVRARLDATLRSTVPQPFGTVPVGEITVGVEEGVGGFLLQNTRSRWTSTSHRVSYLRLVAEWLTEFHSQAEIRRLPWGEVDEVRSLHTRFAAFMEAFGADTATRELFARAQARSTELATASVPLVWSQGDFHAGNVYLDGTRIRVVDWANGGPALPLRDLLKFTEQWATQLRGDWSEAARIRRFREVFVAPAQGDAVAHAVYQEIARYSAALRLDRRLLPLLLVLHWTELALDHQERARCGGAPAHQKYASFAVHCVREIAMANEFDAIRATFPFAHEEGG